jgi:tetratricopeptide (TPR) repeat protein
LLALVLSIITLFFLILTNNWINWIILLIGSVLNFGLCFWQAGEVNNSKKYLLTAGLTIVAVLFLLIKITTLVSTPAEILPNTTTSVAIIKQTLNKYGWWFGSGPGTYLFDYSEFKPLEINQTNFWDTRFNSGASAFFTFLPTLGVIPTVTFLSFFLITLMFFKKNKAEKKSLIIFPPLITVITAFFLYPTNFSLLFLFFLLAGLSETSQKNQNLVFTIKNEKVKKGLLLGLIFILIIALFLSVQRLWADNAFTKAIRNEQGNDLITTITQIDQAASINRFNDVYYRVLAEALFIESQTLTNELKVINPTAEQSAYLKNLLAAGLNSAKLATELEPRRATNWLEFGSIYRAMIGLSDDASGFAISAFKTAIALEPTNPKNYLELGQAFLATKEFSLAEATFNKAIELKPDYANAHYQLALAFEQQGKLDEAIGKMENIIKYNPQDIGATFELGVLYLRRLNEGDLTRAEDILKKTIELLPSFSNARWYLAYTYEKEGKLAEAIAEIEKVLELNPDNEMVKARLERLKNGEGGGEVELME